MGTHPTSSKNGRYVYAVINTNGKQDFGPIGIGGRKVYAISDGRISAVVSRVPNTKIRPQRRNLAAHHQVLKTLMTETTPLPMAFGVIADGDGAVQDILLRQKDLFIEQCANVSGKVEMGLRVTWDVNNIFEFFISTHPDLRTARDTYFDNHSEPSQEDKIELGRLFDHLHQEERENLTENVEQIIDVHCHEIKRCKCRNEKDVMNLACLVARDAESRFEDGVLKAAGQFDNNFIFDYNGPWAPHNFVEIEVEV